MLCDALYVEVEAANLEDAVDQALGLLECTRADAEIEVLPTATPGFMGLFGKKNRKHDRPAVMTTSDLNPEPPSSKEQTPAAPDPIRELARLESMRDRGMLSREEFDREKRKVLASQSYRRI